MKEEIMDKKKQMEILRNRLKHVVSKIPATLKVICGHIGISTYCYHRFMDGGNVSRINTIKITEFCEIHEKEYGWDLLH